jgi:hypothetical protein
MKYSSRSNSRLESSTRLSPRQTRWEEVHLQVPGFEFRGLGLVRASGEGPDTGDQLLEGERLGQVVVRTAVEGAHLVPQLVAGGQHDDRQPGTPGPETLQDLLAVQPRQHNVEQHELHGLVLRQPHPLLTVLGADAPVAVGRQTAFEHPYDARLVFDDQDAHDIGSIIQLRYRLY